MQAPGGGKRDRTDDLLLAKQALSQLSYAPSPGACCPTVAIRRRRTLLIGKGCGDGGLTPLRYTEEVLRVEGDESPRLLEASRRSRKEVIQPQVPLRLPCYDFTPVADPTVVGCLLDG